MLATVWLDSLHFAQFKWQQDVIAATLCENRDMPELHCDGNCYFAKQVRKEQQQQPEYPGVEDRLNLKVMIGQDSETTTMHTVPILGKNEGPEIPDRHAWRTVGLYSTHPERSFTHRASGRRPRK